MLRLGYSRTRLQWQRFLQMAAARAERGQRHSKTARRNLDGNLGVLQAPQRSYQTERPSVTNL